MRYLLDRLTEALSRHPSWCQPFWLPPLPEGLRVTVAGMAQLGSPVTQAELRNLREIGEQVPRYRTDDGPQWVGDRPAWHIPGERVTVDWRGQEEGTLRVVQDAFNLPQGVRLRAQLEALVVYDAGRVPVRPQYSPPEEDMMGTLVVVLPGVSHSGAVTVSAGDGPLRCLSPKLARDADGNRIETPGIDGKEPEIAPSAARAALIYHLMLDSAEDWLAANEGVVARAAELLGRYFAEEPEDLQARAARRFVYLLENDYRWEDLKGGFGALRGSDSYRAAILEAAAQQVGCEVVLGYADVHEGRIDYYNGEYDLYDTDENCLDSYYGRAMPIPEYRVFMREVVVNRLRLSDGICIATRQEIPGEDQANSLESLASQKLKPYARIRHMLAFSGRQEYVWHWRALLLVRPVSRGFAADLTVAPLATMSETLERFKAAQRTGEDQETLAASVRADLWGMKDVLPGIIAEYQSDGGYCGQSRRLLAQVVFQVCSYLGDDELTDLLVAGLRLSDLASNGAQPFIRLYRQRGHSWAAELVHSWNAANPRGFGWSWYDRLPPLVSRLAREPDLMRIVVRRATMRVVAELDQIEEQPGHPMTRGRAPLCSVFGSCRGLLRAISRAPREMQDELLEPVLTALSRQAVADLAIRLARDVDGWKSLEQKSVAVARLREVAIEHLVERVNAPERKPGDWSIEPIRKCACAVCTRVAEFMADPNATRLEYRDDSHEKGAPDRAIHEYRDVVGLEITIDYQDPDPGLPVVFQKTDWLSTSEHRERAEAQRELALLRRRQAGIA